jgi:hypothetical protein
MNCYHVGVLTVRNTEVVITERGEHISKNTDRIRDAIKQELPDGERGDKEHDDDDDDDDDNDESVFSDEI